MGKSVLHPLIAALALMAAGPTLAADDSRIWPAEVSIPNTRQISFTSAINGEPYTLFVSIPFNPPPPGGYPVYYVLDGDAYFSTAVTGSQLLQENAAVIVGIDHLAFNDKAVVANSSSPLSTASPSHHRLGLEAMKLRNAVGSVKSAWITASPPRE